MKNVPNLRFKEFSAEWKDRRLENISTQIGDGIHATPEYVDISQISFINGNNIKDYKITINESTKYISEEEFKKYKVNLNNNSILMSINGTIGNIGYYNNEKVLLGKSVAYININPDKINKFFLGSLLQTNKIQRKFMSELTGTTIKNLSLKSIRDCKVNVPSIEEQEKIASFFSLIDKKIELQTEKVEELKNYKKGIMQKLFPRNGEDIPELRFTGYINDWEHRKISDIFPEIKSGNRLPKTSLSKGTIPYVIAQVTNNGIYMNIDVNTKDYHGNSMKLFNVPCITLSIDNPKAMFIQTTPFYTSNIMRILHNSELELEHYHFILEQIKLLVTYFDWSFKFSGPVIMESKILVPINAGEIDFNEIKKIGSMILQFNNLIDLHQCKLDALIKYKKGLLQQMFI